jgi:hypothetical protein
MSELGDRLLAVHDALDDARIPHAIGGAFALGYCTLEPRGTRDLDVNVFVGPGRVKDVFAALPAAVAISGLSLEQAERDGQVRLWWDETPIDLFFSVLPFHQHVARDVRLVSFEGHAIPVLSCTALAVFKTIFDRPRDWVDIEAMVEARALDLDETIRWVADMAGSDSPGGEKLAALRFQGRS